MEIRPLELYSIQNNALKWEILRPFFEISLQDGFARQGKLAIGNASISSFALVKLTSLNILTSGFQSLGAQICAANGTVIPVNIVVPIAHVALEPRLVIPPPQDSRTQMVVCAHPYLFGPMVPGRSTAAWEEVRNQVLAVRDQVPPEVPAGMVVPAWEVYDFLDPYLRDWQDWKRLSFALIRFDDWAFRNNRHFLKNWQVIRDRLPPDLLRIAWGSISPYLMPLLAYLGFDAVIDLSCAGLADKGISATPYGYVLPRENQRAADSKESMVDQNQVTQQALHHEIVTRISQGTLRELVELSTHFDNPIAATLRIFDMAQREYLSPQARLNKISPLQCTSVEAYFRPEIEFYRQRLQKRYIVPPYKKLAVLLPCSATKPYRESPSHRKMRETIRQAAGSLRFAIEELIMTSPLGMVPRALENVYPAAFYDVPVTGHWDETEIEISTDILASTLAKCPPEMPVVALAEGGYLAVCQQLAKRVSQSLQILTPAPKLLSASVLGNLASFIKEQLKMPDGGAGEAHPSEVEEWCRAVADFQFGAGAGSALFPSRLNVKVPRRGPSLIHDANSSELLATQQASGYYRLQLEGAKRLVQDKIPDFGRIYFAGKAITGSSFFAAGVARVEGEIHPGDVVAVLSQETGDLLATAETVVDGPSMTRMRAGAVAKFLAFWAGMGICPDPPHGRVQVWARPGRWVHDVWVLERRPRECPFGGPTLAPVSGRMSQFPATSSGKEIAALIHCVQDLHLGELL
jgi:archaeosine synthase